MSAKTAKRQTKKPRTRGIQMNRRIYNAVLAAAGVVLVGCETTPTGPPPSVTSSVNIPRLSYTEGATSLQQKSGVSIELTPVTYDLARRVKTEQKDKPRPFLWTEDDPNRETIRWFDKIETPYFVPNPPNLRFAVKISNQMDGTLRLAGSIVTYQVDGKPLQVPAANYAEFVSSIIPRRQTIETFVNGPPVNQLKETGGQVLVSIDDIITERDAAGNPTKRSNFEWIFSYSMEPVTKTDQITVTPMVETRRK